MKQNLWQLILLSAIGLIIGVALFTVTEPLIFSQEIERKITTVTETIYSTTTSTIINPKSTVTNTVTTTKIVPENFTEIIKNTIIITRTESKTSIMTVTLTSTKIVDAESFTILSTSFGEGENIPTKYTCDGTNESPPISWTNQPIDTQSYLLIMDDPDAPIGIFTHWIIFNLSNEISELPEGITEPEILENRGLQGENGLGQIGYFGPCPPPGSTHTYRFHLYALDIFLNLESGASKEEVLRAIEGHVISETEFTGKYSR